MYSGLGLKDRIMAVLKPILLLDSIKFLTLISTIKFSDKKLRFNLDNMIVTALLSMFLSISNVYSAPPALPPPLPGMTNTGQSDKTTIDDPDDVLQEINKFMESKESGTNDPIENNDATNQADSFIDFGNSKLPLLEDTRPVVESTIEVPDISDLPKPQESSTAEVINTQDIQPVKPPPPLVPLPPLQTPVSETIKLPEVKVPDNIQISNPQKQNLETISVSPPAKEPVDRDEIVIPTLDLPPQKSEEPALTPVVQMPVDTTKPVDNSPSDSGGTERTPLIKNMLPKVLDIGRTKGIEDGNSKPPALTPLPVFVQEQTPIEPVEKEVTSTKVDKSNKAQEDKILPAKEQKSINLKNNKKDVKITIKENIANIAPEIPSPEVIKFLQNETQVLLLPNDDVVLGVLTDNAKLEQMDMYKFIKIAKQVYDRKSQAKQRHVIEEFIGTYYRDLKPIIHVPENIIDIAFESVRKNDLFVLRTFVNNYQILQRRGENNYTLLHEAAESDNYYMAKFLIMRGININAVDDQYRTALNIAEDENNNVSCIIRKAQGR